jgi:AcrR family transcriptional regulator
MTSDAAAKPKRSYRSPRRAAQAEQTQQAILDAAQKLFTSLGWSKTTIAAIAKEASVANETVYAVFGSKRAIILKLISNAVRGDLPEVPLLEQSGPQRVARETHQERQIAIFAQEITRILSRVAPLVSVVRTAAETEAELSAVYEALQDGRRRNLFFVVDALQRNGPLRDGLDPTKAAEIIWRLASPELFVLMRNVEGVSPEEYASWLGETLTILLLPDDRQKARPS